MKKEIKGNQFNDRTGEKHTTNEGYEVEIIEYFNTRNCTVKYDTGLIIKGIFYSNLKKGKVSNPFHRSVCGIGYLGIPEDKNEVRNPLIYRNWESIIKRCYSEKQRFRYPTYKDCTVAEEWHNFQNFSKWFKENYNYETMDRWQLDKDILFKGNKIYSPETCAFVPREINMTFAKSDKARGNYPIGVRTMKNKFSARIGRNRRYLGTFNTPEEAFKAYKVAKESYIKEVAEKWKDLIDPRVYTELINYTVEITD